MARGEANLEIELVTKPESRLTVQHFRSVERAVPELPEGEVRVRVVLLSIDAANRAWMQGNVGYRAGVRPGDVMAGNGIGVITESKSADFGTGDLVWGDLGWRRFATISPAKLRHIKASAPLSRHLSLLGVPGKTAYHGLFTVGRVMPGEVVVVSAAGGSIGTLVGQMAKRHGCRVIGIAGGPDKCAWLISDCGYDAAVDHHTPDFAVALRAACPGGIDVYFDNVGGNVLETSLRLMRRRGRIVCCGAVSQYDAGSPTGPRGVPGILAANSLRMEGFLVRDFADQDIAVEAQLTEWMNAGTLRAIEDIHDGLLSAPDALVGLFAGTNRGKVMVRVSADP